MRYESAILLPRDNLDAAAIAALSLGSSLVFAFLFFGLLFANNGEILSLVGLGHIESYWVWIPVGIAATAIFQVLSIWSVRAVRFSKLAFARVNLSAAGAALQVGSGLISANAAALLGGQVMGQILGISILLKDIWRTDKHVFASVTLERIKKVATTYRRFPIFSLPGDLANVLANFIPLLVLGGYFGSAVVGFYALTQKVLAAPVALIGNAILDVFKERAASDYREYGSCRKLYRKTFLCLLLLAAVPSLVLFLFAPPLFAWVFGPEWRAAGEYARILSPLLLVRFVASPLSYVLYIAEKQSVDLVWQVGLLLVSAGTILAGSQQSTPNLSIGLFSVGASIMYLIYIALSYYYAKAPTSEEDGPK